MSDDRQRLLWAIASFEVLRTPTLITAELREPRALANLLSEIAPAAAERLHLLADKLAMLGVGVLFLFDETYPQRLRAIPSPPPILFYLGDLELLRSPAVGMCGSRDASDAGLGAARLCGEQVAQQGLTVVSGYARGVDMATHAGALSVGGRTIIVLAEGMLQFRWKRELEVPTGPDKSRVLVVSQFSPAQTWNAGAAMTRNTVIAALGDALVVIEARESGGTLDAGLQALRLRHPVLALDFSGGAPPGNALLFEKGARRIASTGQLHRELAALRERGTERQLTLAIPAVS